MQSTLYRGITVAGGTLTDTADGTAGRVTNLFDAIQAAAAPDVQLDRALVMSVRVQSIMVPDDTTLRTYSAGLILAPFTLDAADIDPGVSGAQGLDWWTTVDRMIVGQTVTSDDATPEFRAQRLYWRTRGMRRVRGFGTSLLLVERVQGSDLDNVSHLCDIRIGHS